MLSDLELRRKYTAQITRFSTIDAESSLYHGREYRPLADFLSSHNGQGKEREFPFAWLYQFQDGSAEKPRVFASPVAFSSILQDSHIGGRILFLRGYPSAEWIAQIGSQLNIDPDMWRRHLSYLGTSRSTNDFSQPQSFSSQNIFRLCISSAGTRGVLKHPPSRKDLNEDRADAANKMAEYQASLQHNCLKKDDWRLGDSIVRSYNIHDEDLFSVEQYVTVHLIEYDPTSNNWLRKFCPAGYFIKVIPTLTQRQSLSLWTLGKIWARALPAPGVIVFMTITINLIFSQLIYQRVKLPCNLISGMNAANRIRVLTHRRDYHRAYPDSTSATGVFLILVLCSKIPFMLSMSFFLSS